MEVACFIFMSTIMLPLQPLNFQILISALRTHTLPIVDITISQRILVFFLHSFKFMSYNRSDAPCIIVIITPPPSSSFPIPILVLILQIKPTPGLIEQFQTLMLESIITSVSTLRRPPTWIFPSMRRKIIQKHIVIPPTLHHLPQRPNLPPYSLLLSQHAL
jgi:hypothetical protein